ncbi:MAG TPA: DMT family transporter [Gaiellaceae bacterium]|nr:DMT family transporter [Gaiellaceae bacterium]
MIAISQGAGLAVAGLVIAATSASTPSATQLAWAASAGLVGLVGIASFYRALAVGTMGVIGPVTATASIVPVAYGLGRGERPSVAQGVGIALAVVGVIAASVEREHAEAPRRLGAGVGLALLAAASFGWSLVALSRAVPGGVAWSVFTMRAAVVPIVLVVALSTAGRVARSRRAWLLLVGVGAADTGATILYGAATTRGLLSIVAVLASLYPIVIVVLARVLLSERIARPQLVGVVVALTGVALVSAG